MLEAGFEFKISQEQKHFLLFILRGQHIRHLHLVLLSL
jgi:hypothetical protein